MIEEYSQDQRTYFQIKKAPKNTKTLIQKDICTVMFLVVLFTVTRYENNLCPSMDEWIKKMCIPHTGILLSHQKGGILPFVTALMDLEGSMLSDISQMEKDKYCVISLICGIYKQNKINEQTK